MVLLASATGLFLVAVALVALAVILVLLAPRLGRSGVQRREQAPRPGSSRDHPDRRSLRR